MATTLTEFVKELQNDILEFQNYWLKQRKTDPNKDHWPLELDNSAEWFEHFMFWSNTEEK